MTSGEAGNAAVGLLIVVGLIIWGVTSYSWTVAFFVVVPLLVWLVSRTTGNNEPDKFKNTAYDTQNVQGEKMYTLTAEPDVPLAGDYHSGNSSPQAIPLTRQKPPLNNVIEFSYIDHDGKDTRRVVEIYHAASDGIRFSGFCRKKMDERTFYSPKVTDAVDSFSGEKIKEVMQYIADMRHLLPTIKPHPFPSEAKDIAMLLFCIGKADGQLRPNERAIICEAIHGITGKTEVSYVTIVNYLYGLSMPELDKIIANIEKIAEHKREWGEKIIAAAEKIIGPGVKAHPFELILLNMIKEKFVR